MIVNFLDRKTAAIDALIEKKQKLVELIEEERTAIASQAVTKGFASTHSMRKSGIPWVGDIPTHWTVLRTRFLCEITTGGKDTQDAEVDAPFPFFVRSQTIESISTWSYDGEGVLTARDGAGVAKVFHYHSGKKELHQRVYLFHKFRKVTGKFFFYYLKEHLRYVALAGNAKSTVDSLRRPMLQDFLVPFPSIEEQQAIVERLEKEMSKRDQLERLTQTQIEKLQQYRQALITAAVTGQLEIPEGAQ